MVQQGLVVLVADRAHHGGVGREHRAQQGFVAEGQQVLESTATAGDHDHVHLLHAVQLLQCADDRAGRARSLHRDLADLELHTRPAVGGVAHHVLLRVRVPSGDQTHAVGEHGKRLLARGVEEPLVRQGAAQPFQPLQQVPEPHGADVLPQHGEPAGLDVEVRLEAHHHPRAALQRTLQAGHLVLEERDTHRGLLLQVPEGHVADPGPLVDLDHLALHPRGRGLLDPAVQGVGQLAQRPRVLRGGVPGQLGQLHRRLAGGRGVVRGGGAVPIRGALRAGALGVRGKRGVGGERGVHDT